MTRARTSATSAAAFAAAIAALAWTAPPAAPPANAAATTRRPAARAPAPARPPVRRAPRPAAAPPAPATAKSYWTRARGLADDGRNAQALAVLDSALAVHPGDVDLLWLRAAVTGYAGRHGEALRLYTHLQAEHPERARDLRADIAAERLWSGDPRGAVRDYDLRLREEPGDRDARRMRALALSHADRLPESLAAYDELLRETPDDVDLLLERARVLAWMGRNADAEAVDRQVLNLRPNDRRAQLGLAQNENWRGHHRTAAALLEPLAQGPDADPEAIKALAFARYWSGDSRAARIALDRYQARVPEDREGRELAARLADERAGWIQLGVGREDDSDAQRVVTTSMELHAPLGPATSGAIGWRRDNVRDPGGTRDPLTLGASLEHVFSATWTWRANLAWADLGDSAGTAGLGEIGTTIRPTDGVRFDAGVARDLVRTRVALRQGISVLTWVGGVDWDATDRIRLHADGRLRGYSDDNRAEQVALAARGLAFARKPLRAHVGLRLEQLNTRFDLDHGYYDPDFYREWGPTLDVEWTPAPPWTVSGEGRTGWQREKGGDTKPFYGIEGSAEVSIAKVWRLAVGGTRSNSNLQSQSGYERRSWRLALTRGF